MQVGCGYPTVQTREYALHGMAITESKQANALKIMYMNTRLPACHDLPGQEDHDISVGMIFP